MSYIRVVVQIRSRCLIPWVGTCVPHIIYFTERDSGSERKNLSNPPKKAREFPNSAKKEAPYTRALRIHIIYKKGEPKKGYMYIRGRRCSYIVRVYIYGCVPTSF